jgi:predicted nuclease with TOPRIM domain
MYREVLESRERVLGREHVSSVLTRNELISTLFRQGNHDEGAQLACQALELGELHRSGFSAAIEHVRLLKENDQVLKEHDQLVEKLEQLSKESNRLEEACWIPE